MSRKQIGGAAMGYTFRRPKAANYWTGDIGRKQLIALKDYKWRQSANGREETRRGVRVRGSRRNEAQ